jgi:hypothetical protein
MPRCSAQPREAGAESPPIVRIMTSNRRREKLLSRAPAVRDNALRPFSGWSSLGLLGCRSPLRTSWSFEGPKGREHALRSDQQGDVVDWQRVPSVLSGVDAAETPSGTTPRGNAGVSTACVGFSPLGVRFRPNGVVTPSRPRSRQLSAGRPQGWARRARRGLSESPHTLSSALFSGHPHWRGACEEECCRWHRSSSL